MGLASDCTATLTLPSGSQQQYLTVFPDGIENCHSFLSHGRSLIASCVFTGLALLTCGAFLSLGWSSLDSAEGGRPLLNVNPWYSRAAAVCLVASAVTGLITALFMESSLAKNNTIDYVAGEQFTFNKGAVYFLVWTAAVVLLVVLATWAFILRSVDLGLLPAGQLGGEAMGGGGPLPVAYDNRPYHIPPPQEGNNINEVPANAMRQPLTQAAY